MTERFKKSRIKFLRAALAEAMCASDQAAVKRLTARVTKILLGQEKSPGRVSSARLQHNEANNYAHSFTTVGSSRATSRRAGKLAGITTGSKRRLNAPPR